MYIIHSDFHICIHLPLLASISVKVEIHSWILPLGSFFFNIHRQPLGSFQYNRALHAFGVVHTHEYSIDVLYILLLCCILWMIVRRGSLPLTCGSVSSLQLEGYWTYEFCPHRHVRQFHVEKVHDACTLIYITCFLSFSFSLHLSFSLSFFLSLSLSLSPQSSFFPFFLSFSFIIHFPFSLFSLPTPSFLYFVEGKHQWDQKRQGHGIFSWKEAPGTFLKKQGKKSRLSRVFLTLLIYHFFLLENIIYSHRPKRMKSLRLFYIAALLCATYPRWI